MPAGAEGGEARRSDDAGNDRGAKGTHLVEGISKDGGTGDDSVFGSSNPNLTDERFFGHYQLWKIPTTAGWIR